MTPRVLITGISGFTGRWMAAEAQRQGAELVGLSRQSTSMPGVRLHLCDLSDSPRLSEIIAAEQAEIIFHLASPTPANSPQLSPQAWVTESALATLNLLEAVRTRSAHTLTLIVSSSAVYGHIPEEYMPIHEDIPLRPTTMYGVSKASQELISSRYTSEYAIPIICARPFNLIGPGESARMLTSVLAAQVALLMNQPDPEPIRLRHRKTQRDYTDIRDAVHAYWLLATQGRPGHMYNVCSGNAQSIGHVLDRLLDIANVHTQIEETHPVPATNDILVQQGSYAKLQAHTGWQPRISLDQSLSDLLHSFHSSAQKG